MKDIQVIGSDFQRGSFEILPESIDRLRACHYFCSRIQEYSTEQNDIKARWYFRAAMAGFNSALETVNSDIKAKMGKNTWCRSEQQIAMYDYPLVKILTKTRNLVVHSARITGEARKYTVRVLNENGEKKEEMRSLFFEKLTKNKNLKGVSKISSVEIQWFNETVKNLARRLTNSLRIV